jgi:hypothetical protein
LERPESLTVIDGQATLKFQLPRQGISLVVLEFESNQ